MHRPLSVLLLAVACDRAVPVEASSASRVAPPELDLHHNALVAGQPATLTVSGARSGEQILIGRATRSGTLCPGLLGQLCLDLGGQPVLAATLTADGAGVATLVFTVPTWLPPEQLVVFQAAARRGVGGARSVDSHATISRVVTQMPTPLSAVTAGQLQLTEVMHSPSMVDSSVGVWVEVHNRGMAPVELRGLQLSSMDGDSLSVEDSLVVRGLGYAVLTTHHDPAVNGGIQPDHVGGGLDLANVDDLTLVGPQGVLDQLAWTLGSPATAVGASLSRDPITGAWCASSAPYGAGDLGTPGQANPPCDTPWYADQDGDGFGDPGWVQHAPTAPPGFVADASDCDDAQATVYPGAAERCDGVQNNCGSPWTAGDEDGLASFEAATGVWAALALDPTGQTQITEEGTVWLCPGDHLGNLSNSVTGASYSVRGRGTAATVSLTSDPLRPAVYSNSADLVVRDVTLRGGEQVRVQGGSLHLADVVVEHGRGVYVWLASGLIERSIIQDNFRTEGGGLQVGGDPAVVTIRETRISGNSAVEGGGVYVWSGATVLCEDSLAPLHGIFANSASEGGGVYLGPATTWDTRFRARGCSFGSGVTANDPTDVDVGSRTYSWGLDASFDCDTGGC